MIKEKEYNIKTRVLSVFLIAAVVCSFMPLGAVITDKANANKGDKITLKVDEKIYYGGAWTTKLEVTDTTADMEDAEGRFVYCVQPSKYTPGPGEYTINKATRRCFINAHVNTHCDDDAPPQVNLRCKNITQNKWLHL